MVYIVTIPCHCLSLTLHNLILFLFLYWSFKALSAIKEGHYAAWGILKSVLAAQFLCLVFTIYILYVSPSMVS